MWRIGHIFNTKCVVIKDIKDVENIGYTMDITHSLRILDRLLNLKSIFSESLANSDFFFFFFI